MHNLENKIIYDIDNTLKCKLTAHWPCNNPPGIWIGIKFTISYIGLPHDHRCCTLPAACMSDVVIVNTTFASIIWFIHVLHTIQNWSTISTSSSSASPSSSFATIITWTTHTPHGTQCRFKSRRLRNGLWCYLTLSVCWLVPAASFTSIYKVVQKVRYNVFH